MNNIIKLILLLIFGFLIFISFDNIDPKSSKEIKIENTIELTNKLTSIDLDYGFKITYNYYKEGDYIFYDNVKLSKDNKLIFTDTDTSFMVEDNYPSIRKIGDHFEILLVVFDAPYPNKLMMLKISSNTVIEKTLIPFFEMTPRDIDSDGKLELVGVMGYYQVSGENNDMMPYLPILVYEYTESGIALDSVETEKVNTRIYGKFYGFDYSEKYEFKDDGKFGNEFKKYIDN